MKKNVTAKDLKVKKEKLVEVEVELSDAEHKALVKEAKKRGITFNALCVWAVEEYMKEHKKK